MSYVDLSSSVLVFRASLCGWKIHNLSWEPPTMKFEVLDLSVAILRISGLPALFNGPNRFWFPVMGMGILWWDWVFR